MKAGRERTTGVDDVDDESAIGFSLIRFGVDDIMDTTQLIDNQGEGLG